MIHKEGDIYLRTPVSGDLEIILNWENNPENWKVSGTRKPFTADEIKQFIENCSLSIKEMGQQRFIMERKGLPLGTLDFFDFDEANGRVGVGVLIASASERNKGNAFLALKMGLRYAFEDLKVHQVFCNVLSDNIPSLKLFRKLGFKEVGVKQDWVLFNEVFHDEVMLQLLRSDWNEG